MEVNRLHQVQKSEGVQYPQGSANLPVAGQPFGLSPSVVVSTRSMSMTVGNLIFGSISEVNNLDAEV
jgi:hypothetical protein